MDLKHALLKEHSKAQCNRIVKWVGADQSRFDELFHLFLTGDYRIVQRAAWSVSFSVIAHPTLIKKHFGRLIKNLEKPDLHVAVKRNSVRLLQHIPIPKVHQGRLMNICFGFIESPQEAIAVKAFSLTVLQKLAEQHPDILPELKIVIEEQLPHQTAAFRVRARPILRM